MNPYAPIAPPRRTEAIESLAGVLQDDLPLQNGLGGEGRVFIHMQPASKPERRVIIREPVIPGGQPEHWTRTTRVRILIVVECDRTLPNFARWLELIHTRIYNLLTGLLFHSLAFSEQAKRVRRMTVPTAPAYDADDDAYYSSSEYEIILHPIHITP